MPTKKSSKLGRLNVFANSPRFVKFFGPLVLIITLAAVGYGVYTLTVQKSSDAAYNGKHTWKYSSAGISHQAGHLENDMNSLLGINRKGAKGPVWYGDSLAGGSNKFVWDGPGVHLGTNRQYLGCFEYQVFAIATPSVDEAVASLDIHDSNGGGKTYNTYWVSEYTTYSGGNVHGIENITNQTRGKGGFARTCLAFFVPKSAKNNRISLRAKLYTGRIAVKKTKITRVLNKENSISNLWLLHKHLHDNSTILHGSNYK